MSKVVLTMVRFGSPYTEEHETLREALESASAAVESNEAAPTSLECPRTLIGTVLRNLLE